MAKSKYRHLKDWFTHKDKFWEKVKDGIYFSVRFEGNKWWLIIRRSATRKEIAAKNSFHAYNMANKYMAKMEE